MDAAEPDISSYFIPHILLACQNLEPTLTTMQLDYRQFSWGLTWGHLSDYTQLALEPQRFNPGGRVVSVHSAYHKTSSVGFWLGTFVTFKPCLCLSVFCLHLYCNSLIQWRQKCWKKQSNYIKREEVSVLSQATLVMDFKTYLTVEALSNGHCEHERRSISWFIWSALWSVKS